MLTSNSLRNTQVCTIISFQLRWNDVSLSKKTCVKYQGVLIESKSDWISHVQLVRTKLSRSSYLIFTN